MNKLCLLGAAALIAIAFFPDLASAQRGGGGMRGGGGGGFHGGGMGGGFRGGGMGGGFRGGAIGSGFRGGIGGAGFRGAGIGGGFRGAAVGPGFRGAGFRGAAISGFRGGAIARGGFRGVGIAGRASTAQRWAEALAWPPPWRGLGLAQRLGSAPRSRSRVGLRLLLLLVRVLLGPLRRLEWLHLGEHLLLRWLAIETPRRGPPVQPGGFCISAVTAPHLSEPHTCGHRPAPPLPRMYRHGDVWSVLDLNNGDHRRRTVSMRRRDFISLLVVPTRDAVNEVRIRDQPQDCQDAWS